jgi:hypothetical protein
MPSRGKTPSRRGVGRALVVVIVVVVALAVVGTASYLLYFNPSTSAGIGTSTIQLSQTSGSVAAGGSTSVSYTVSLATGTKWGTSLVVSNGATLAGDGITVTPSTGAMDPSYTGSLSIGVAASATPGAYQIVLKTTGDDPSATNVVFSLTVSAPSSTSTSTSATSTTSTTTTSSSSSSNGYGY